MKKLVCAAFVAASMVALAEEAEKKPAAAPAATAEVKAAPAANRPQLTDEQRQKMREQREKFMAERKAKMEAKLLEVIKKYVPEDDKAKALLKDLQEAMMAGRRPPMGPRRPLAKPAAEAK